VPPFGNPPGAAPPALRFEMPSSLYAPPAAGSGVNQSAPAVSLLGGSGTWFIPALVTGVPGLLIIILVLMHALLGLSWLPNVNRLLGPELDAPDDDDQVWWAAGRPLR
jgi:hypothetical protein